MYRIKHISHCGMLTFSERADDEAEVRALAANLIKKFRRKGLVVTTLDSGEEWEVLEPQDCVMVPDDCGVIRVYHVTFECRECGSRHEFKQDSLECCQEFNEFDYLEEERYA